MKTTLQKKNKGITLIELTVVILVLLSLISVLFIGARAWKQGTDRAQCILNIRNVQTSGRSLQNMYGFQAGNAFNADQVPGDPANLQEAIIGREAAAAVPPSDGNPGSPAVTAVAGFMESRPSCPGGGDYTFATSFPALGALFMTCSLATELSHVPSDTAGW